MRQQRGGLLPAAADSQGVYTPCTFFSPPIQALLALHPLATALFNKMWKAVMEPFSSLKLAFDYNRLYMIMLDEEKREEKKVS